MHVVTILIVESPMGRGKFLFVVTSLIVIVLCQLLMDGEVHVGKCSEHYTEEFLHPFATGQVRHSGMIDKIAAEEFVDCGQVILNLYSPESNKVGIKIAHLGWQTPASAEASG